MKLPPWEDLVTLAMENYMTQYLPASAIRLKLQAWQNVGNGFKLRIYDRIKPRLVKECQAVGLNPDTAFPEPEGMAEYRAKREKGIPVEEKNMPFTSEIESGHR